MRFVDCSKPLDDVRETFRNNIHESLDKWPTDRGSKERARLEPGGEIIPLSNEDEVNRLIVRCRTTD